MIRSEALVSLYFARNRKILINIRLLKVSMLKISGITTKRINIENITLKLIGSKIEKKKGGR